RLAEVDVAQPYVVQELQFRADARLILEEIERLRHRHVEHIGDRLSFITHLERLPVVAPPLAHLAGDVHIGEEVHLDLHEADTPVTATNRPNGTSTVRSRRLCWRAPMTTSLRSGSGVRRRGGTGIRSSPLR